MIYSERTGRSAAIIDENGSVSKLNRIPFMQGSFNEAWLQELLEDNPTLIPSGEVNGEYAPLVCIGREVPVGSGDMQGYIDNLYVTPSGCVVVVETKLFRNQESRRTVVAQIIDYAKELQKWDYSKLDAVAREYTYKKMGQSFKIIDLMAKYGYLNLSDEARLNDSINKNLQSASLLLMIVGDGIRTGVQQLADFLNDNARMSFNLALAEMEVYQSGTDIIVIPNLVTKTTVIERTVSGSGMSTYHPSAEEPKRPYARKPVLSRREFISTFADNGGYDPDAVTEFISDLEAINGLTVKITPTELTIQFCPGADATYPLLTFGIAQSKADIWLMPGRIKQALDKHGVFPFEADDFLDFYKQFVDLSRCKTEPYEYEAGFYYAKVDEVFRYTQDFISAAEEFAVAISK